MLVDGLVKLFGSKSAPVEALRSVALTVEVGQRMALWENLARGSRPCSGLLGGLDRPTAGSIRVAGRDLARLSADALAYRLTEVGMIFQAYNLIPSRTAIENVELPMILAGRQPAKRKAAARRRSRPSAWATDCSTGPSSSQVESISRSPSPGHW